VVRNEEGGLMTEEEAKAILKAYGWSWKVRTRKNGLPYLYAMRHVKGRYAERYLCPLSRLPKLSEAELTRKLTES
jgi:hypothetical protein